MAGAASSGQQVLCKSNERYGNRVDYGTGVMVVGGWWAGWASKCGGRAGLTYLLRAHVAHVVCVRVPVCVFDCNK